MQRRLQLILLSIAALLAGPAWAQDGFELLGVDNGRPAAAASYTGPGDIVSGASFWIGLRAYSSAKANGATKAIRVVRANDGHACDVTLDTSGNLGKTAAACVDGAVDIASWCAATTCSIDQWYDQVNGTAMWVANTSSTRAILSFSCLGALVCADFAANLPSYYAGSNPAVSQAPAFTTSLVAIQTGSLTSQNDILDVGSGSFFVQAAGVQKVGGYWGVAGLATQSAGAWHAIQIVTASTSSAVAVDATQTTTGVNMGTNAQPASSFLGTQNSVGTNAFNGKLTEVGVWPVAFTTTQMTNVCHNQFTYWGTPTSC